MTGAKTVLVACSSTYKDPAWKTDVYFAEYLVEGATAADLTSVRAAGMLTEQGKSMIETPPTANITWATAQVQIGEGRVLVKCTTPINNGFNTAIYSAVQFTLP